MQTSAAALRISAVAHSRNPIMTTQVGQVIVFDTRLRQWSLAFGGGLTGAYTLRALLTGDGNLLRIRTLAANLLDVQYATPADTLTWSGNTLSASAKAGTGVDLYVDGDNVDAFWIASDGITLKTAHSTDDGHTWGSAVTVATLPAQGAGVLPQLCAPAANIVIFSDSTVGLDAAGKPLTALYVSVRVSGTWNTPTLWDLGGQPLGIETPVTLPDGSTYPSNLSGIELSEGRVELAWYGNRPRDYFGNGVWVQRVANLDTASATQHLHWSQPDTVFKSNPIDDDNNSTQIFLSFPRLQKVGSEQWIVALESSKFAGNLKYHLAFINSADGSAWNDRDYRQGAADQPSEQTGAYLYDGDTPFLATDLIYASLVVAGNRTFLVGYDKTFWCPSTLAVGVDNPAMRLDVTALVTAKNLSQPAAPTAVQAAYPIQNTEAALAAADLLTAHRGVRVVQQSGYVTSEGAELLTLATMQLDALAQSAAIDSRGKVTNAMTMTALDDTQALQRAKMDNYYELQGIQSIALQNFCDLSPLNGLWGNYFSNAGGQLVADVVTAGDNFRDDIAAVLADQSADGAKQVKFRCNTTWGSDTLGAMRNHAGICFQGKGGSNDEYWAVLYDRTLHKFTLNQAIPRVNPNRHQLYKYKGAVATSAGDYDLDSHTWYWLKVLEWHGHVMVWYTDDVAGVPDPDWTLVLDYTSPASPASGVLPCRLEWFGVSGTQHINPGGAQGQLGYASGGQDLSDGSLHPLIVALHIPLSARKSTLKRVNVTLTQENPNSDPMPNWSALVLAGDATTPFDATDEENVIFQYDDSATLFGVHDSPADNGVNPQPNPEKVRFDSAQDVWVAVTFADDLVSGQSYKWWGDNTSGYGANQTKISSDGGATWISPSDVNLNLRASIEVDYDAGSVRFGELEFITADPVRTLENVTHQLAAKAGILNLTADAWLAQADLGLGGDGILWQPIDFGTIGDMPLDVDVTIADGDTAIVVLRATAMNAGVGNGFQIVLDPTAQTVSFYGLSATLTGVFASAQYLPVGRAFHLQIVNTREFLLVYVNEALAATQYDPSLNVKGYVGLVNAGATWANARIPDLYQTVEYWSLDAKQTPLESLQTLVAKPAPGTLARGKFFVRYDGSLRLLGPASYRGDPVMTFAGTMLKATHAFAAHSTLTQVSPQSNSYAERWDGDGLDTEGRVFDQLDYTDAQTDADAYLAGADPLRDAKEKSETFTLDHIADFALEREDKVEVTDPATGVSEGIYLVNDFSPTAESIDPTRSKMTLGLRKYFP